jgi:hypothetical protein
MVEFDIHYGQLLHNVEHNVRSDEAEIREGRLSHFTEDKLIRGCRVFSVLLLLDSFAVFAFPSAGLR